MSYFYPALLHLEDRRCLVVGGGTIAARKVRSLLACGARVTVVAPRLTPALEQLHAAGHIDWRPRPYQAGDLEGIFLTIAATDDESINDAVWREASSRHGLVNTVDDPARCSFVVPSTLRRGDLTISIGTGGKSPALAKKVRQDLETIFPPAYARLVELLGRWREALGATGDQDGRARLWDELVRGDLLQLIEEGREELAQERFEHARQALERAAGAAEE